MSCPVCLIDHDPEIHAATVRVHRWFRRFVMPREVKRSKRRSKGTGMLLAKPDTMYLPHW